MFYENNHYFSLCTVKPKLIDKTTMDSEAVINSVRKGLEHADLDATGLTFCMTVTGGIVNQAALYQTTTKNYFVKWNSKSCVSNSLHK